MPTNDILITLIATDMKISANNIRIRQKFGEENAVLIYDLIADTETTIEQLSKSSQIAL